MCRHSCHNRVEGCSQSADMQKSRCERTPTRERFRPSHCRPSVAGKPNRLRRFSTASTTPGFYAMGAMTRRSVRQTEIMGQPQCCGEHRHVTNSLLIVVSCGDTPRVRKIWQNKTRKVSWGFSLSSHGGREGLWSSIYRFSDIACRNLPSCNTAVIADSCFGTRPPRFADWLAYGPWVGARRPLLT